MNAWSAFAGCTDQVAKCWATDYHDTWFSNAQSEFNVYYVCLGKTGGGPNKDDWVDMRCRTAIASVLWG
eukprot:6484787-Lingulodinium_polyedra.AAC.1